MFSGRQRSSNSLLTDFPKPTSASPFLSKSNSFTGLMSGPSLKGHPKAGGYLASPFNKSNRPLAPPLRCKPGSSTSFPTSFDRHHYAIRASSHPNEAFAGLQSPHFGKDEQNFQTSYFDETSSLGNHETGNSTSLSGMRQDAKYPLNQLNSMHSSIRERLAALQSDLYAPVPDHGVSPGVEMPLLPLKRAPQMKSPLVEVPEFSKFAGRRRQSISALTSSPNFLMSNDHPISRSPTSIAPAPPSRLGNNVGLCQSSNFLEQEEKEIIKAHEEDRTTKPITDLKIESGEHVNGSTQEVAQSRFLKNSPSEMDNATTRSPEKTQVPCTTKFSPRYMDQQGTNHVLAELQELKAMVTSIVSQRETLTSTSASSVTDTSISVGTDNFSGQPSFVNESDEDPSSEMDMCRMKQKQKLPKVGHKSLSGSSTLSPLSIKVPIAPPHYRGSFTLPDLKCQLSDSCRSNNERVARATPKKKRQHEKVKTSKIIQQRKLENEQEDTDESQEETVDVQEEDGEKSEESYQDPSDDQNTLQEKTENSVGTDQHYETEEEEEEEEKDEETSEEQNSDHRELKQEAHGMKKRYFDHDIRRMSHYQDSHTSQDSSLQENAFRVPSRMVMSDYENSSVDFEFLRRELKKRILKKKKYHGRKMSATKSNFHVRRYKKKDMDSSSTSTFRIPDHSRRKPVILNSESKCLHYNGMSGVEIPVILLNPNNFPVSTKLNCPSHTLQAKECPLTVAARCHEDSLVHPVDGKHCDHVTTSKVVHEEKASNHLLNETPESSHQTSLHSNVMVDRSRASLPGAFEKQEEQAFLRESINELVVVKEKLIAEQHQLMMKVEALKMEVVLVQQEEEAQKRLIEKSKKDLDETQKELDETQKELETTRSAFQENTDRLSNDLIVIRESRDKLQNLLSLQEEHLKAAHDGLDKLEEERQRLLRELTALERLDADKDSMIQGLHTQELNRNVELQTLREKVVEIESQRNKKEEEVQQMIHKINLLEAENGKIVKDHAILLNQVKNGISGEEAEKLKYAVQSYQEKYDEGQMEINNLRHELDSCMKTRKKFEQDLLETTHDMEMALDIARKKIASAEAERNEAVERFQNFAKQVESSHDEEKQRVEQDKALLEKQLHEMQGELEEYKALYNKVGEELVVLKQQVVNEDKEKAYHSVVRENEQLKERVHGLMKSKNVLEDDLRSTLHASRELHQKIMVLQASGLILTEKEQKRLRECEREWGGYQERVKARRRNITRVKVIRLQLCSSMDSRLTKGIQAGPPSCLHSLSFRGVVNGAGYSLPKESCESMEMTSPVHTPHSSSRGVARTSSDSPLGLARHESPKKRWSRYTVNGRVIKSTAKSKEEPVVDKSDHNNRPQWEKPTRSFEMRRLEAMRKESHNSQVPIRGLHRVEPSGAIFRRNRPLKTEESFVFTQDLNTSPSGKWKNKETFQDSQECSREPRWNDPNLTQRHGLEARHGLSDRPFSGVSRYTSPESSVSCTSTSSGEQMSTRETDVCRKKSGQELCGRTSTRERGPVDSKTSGVQFTMDSSNFNTGTLTLDTPDFGSLCSHHSTHEFVDVSERKTNLNSLRKKLLSEGVLEGTEMKAYDAG